MADRLRPRVQKLAGLMDKAELDVLAYMDVPAAHGAAARPWKPWR